MQKPHHTPDTVSNTQIQSFPLILLRLSVLTFQVVLMTFLEVCSLFVLTIQDMQWTRGLWRMANELSIARGTIENTPEEPQYRVLSLRSLPKRWCLSAM